MKPTDDLVAEHRAVLLALQLLDEAGSALEAGDASAPGHLDELLDFLRGFVDKCHHGKEEDVLFPELVERDASLAAGPVAMMLAEHESGRRHVRAIGEALGRVRNGDREAASVLRGSAQAYGALLQAHIAKENGVLFPLADRLLPADASASVLERFDAIERDRVGEGKHEAYHTMLHALKDHYHVA